MARTFWAAFLLLVLAFSAYADPFDDCSEHLPFGIPTLTQAVHTSAVCHRGYAALVDDDRLVPRWVAYYLTAEHTLGCIKRTNNFHADEQPSAVHHAIPKDYTNSGYDRGHHAPADDFAWDEAEMRDSFSMANMAPQLHSLNAGAWEKGENDVRAWALERGELLIYVGSILADGDQTIGADHVDVPSAFWKVVVDPARHQAVAWIMPQDAPANSDVRKWLQPVEAIEAASGVILPLPFDIDLTVVAMWPADVKAWKDRHAAACPSERRTAR